MTTIRDAANNQPLPPDLATEVESLIDSLNEIIDHYQSQGSDPSDNWDFEEALNALGAALYSNSVDAIILPDGRIFNVRSHEVVNHYIYLDITPPGGEGEATYWANDNETINGLWPIAPWLAALKSANPETSEPS